jgi:hypothetical protein
MQSTLLPAGGGWDALPEPILVRDLRAHARRLAPRPPAVVAPRLIGHGVAWWRSRGSIGSRSAPTASSWSRSSRDAADTR